MAMMLIITVRESALKMVTIRMKRKTKRFIKVLITLILQKKSS